MHLWHNAGFPFGLEILVNSRSEYHIEVVEAKYAAVDLLSSKLDLSKQKTKEVMQKGCVWLEPGSGDKQKIRRLRRAKKILSTGMVLHCYFDPQILSLEPIPAKLVADMGDYSVWNKPAGMLSQGSKWGDHGTLYRWAEKHIVPERSAFLIHRLDRAASGLMLLAHKKQTAVTIGKMFQDRKIDKRYNVIVNGDCSTLIPSGEFITLSIPLDDKEAISHVQFMRFDKESNQSTMQVKIETGRKHQIRRHMAGLGFAVKGDRLYGNADSTEPLQLTSEQIGFVCPIDGTYRQYSLFADPVYLPAKSKSVRRAKTNEVVANNKHEVGVERTSWDRFKRKL